MIVMPIAVVIVIVTMQVIVADDGTALDTTSEK
jgi:hypothetical protein